MRVPLSQPSERADWPSSRPLGIASLAASQQLISCRPESLQPLPLQMHFLTMYKIFINGKECISKGERESVSEGETERELELGDRQH